MTALTDYARLETTGLWRQAFDKQRREVGVSFGEATLVISDASGRPLTHWSLAAVTRLNPKTRPALFGPGGGSGGETLEIEDEDMIRAIAKVQRVITRARPRPGRLRWGILAASTALLIWLGAFWLPKATINHATRVVPEVKRQEIGRALLLRTTRIAGQPCADPFGSVALRRIEAALTPSTTLHVLSDGLAGTASLPGGHLLIGRSLIEDHDDPAVLAGYLVAERQRAMVHDPLGAVLASAAPFGAMRLLTSGTLPDAALDAYAEEVLLADPAPLQTASLLARFEEAGLPSAPYAYARDITGETTLALIEADPFPGKEVDLSLSDGEWLSLQDICAE